RGALRLALGGQRLGVRSARHRVPHRGLLSAAHVDGQHDATGRRRDPLRDAVGLQVLAPPSELGEQARCDRRDARLHGPLRLARSPYLPEEGPLMGATANGTTPAVAIRDLTKQFGKQFALDGVSFEIPQGSVFGLLGPNGAGKTTLFSLVAGFL